MDPRHPYPLNDQILTPSQGGALQLTGGNPYLPNSTRILNRPSQTCRMILVPLLLVILYAATTGKFLTPHLICVNMPQIM